MKVHPKTAEANDADSKIKKAYLRIEEAERAMRSGGSGDLDDGIGGVGSVENRLVVGYQEFWTPVATPSTCGSWI